MECRMKDYEEVIQEVLDSGGEFQIYPKGTSMLPLICQGRDWVTLIKPVSPPGPGDIVLYKRKNGAYVLHRIMKEGQDGYILCGDNQTDPEAGIVPEQIIGVVNTLGRKGKTFLKTDRPVRLYEWVWCFLPLRKLYFRLFGHRYPKNW